MALVAGSVTSVSVDSSANITVNGTGLAVPLCEASLESLKAVWLSTYALPELVHQLSNVAASGSFWVEFANRQATALVAYLVANAEVVTGTLAAHVTTQQLGRVPSSTTAGTPIDAPASAVDVPLTGAGTLQ